MSARTGPEPTADEAGAAVDDGTTAEDDVADAGADDDTDDADDDVGVDDADVVVPGRGVSASPEPTPWLMSVPEDEPVTEVETLSVVPLAPQAPGADADAGRVAGRVAGRAAVDPVEPVEREADSAGGVTPAPLLVAVCLPSAEPAAADA